MKLVVLILCVFCLNSVLSVRINKKKCEANDCFCTERSAFRNAAKKTDRNEFLIKQKSLDNKEFKAECEKVEKQLKVEWGKFAEDTQCDQMKLFVKKRLLLWKLFCNMDSELRKEFDGEFFGKYEECDKYLHTLCLDETVNYCEQDSIDKGLKCIEDNIKGKCENYDLFFAVTKAGAEYYKENNICGGKHPAVLNYYKKP